MEQHDFIIASGVWLGEGKLSFTLSPNILRYYTKWTVAEEQDGVIVAVQEVELEGREENQHNRLIFRKSVSENFLVTYSHQILGDISGEGTISNKGISWRLLKHPEFEGVEEYERNERGGYQVHAEYLSGDFKTIVDGRIWRITG